MASHHPQSINQHANEQIGLPQILAVLPRHNSAFHQPSQRLHRVRRAQNGMLMAMHELEILDSVLDIDKTSVAKFDVDRSAFDQLLELLPSQIKGGSQIPGFAAVAVPVPVGFNLPSERRISRYV